MDPATGGCAACVLDNCVACDTDGATGGELCITCKEGWELQYPEDESQPPACVQQKPTPAKPTA